MKKKKTKKKMFEKLIAVCGINCSACPAYIATKNNDVKEKKRIAKLWSEEFGVKLRASDIHCVGCINKKGPHVNYCNVCEIRLCANDKGLNSCAECNEFMCETLKNFIQFLPEAQLNLEEKRITRAK